MKQRIFLSFALQIAIPISMALAQQPKVTPVPPTPQAPTAGESKVTEPPHELTVEDVHAFLDGFVPMQLEREDIAGAVVLVVKDGAIFFAKGYGYSDVEKKTPVTVDATLFRPGSVSKLFTWTAVMQLVEQGKLDLDADVNKYLPNDFQVPPRDGKPITLRNIMTHTAGYEEQIKNIITENPDTPDFVTLLKRWMPNRVFDAGTTPAYSNYATSLAGYIVERVSGEPFYDYMDKHVFAPLEMNHSSFRQPLPKDLVPLMSTGYATASEPAKKFEMVGPAP